MARLTRQAPDSRNAMEMDALSSLLWHVGTFVVINAFLWIQDLVSGGGLEYAYWTTIPWAVGLAFHVAAYFFAARWPADDVLGEPLAHEEEKALIR